MHGTPSPPPFITLPPLVPVRTLSLSLSLSLSLCAARRPRLFTNARRNQTRERAPPYSLYQVRGSAALIPQLLLPLSATPCPLPRTPGRARPPPFSNFTHHFKSAPLSPKVAADGHVDASRKGAAANAWGRNGHVTLRPSARDLARAGHVARPPRLSSRGLALAPAGELQVRLSPRARPRKVQSSSS